ncbi:MAG TPA: GH116 family glycosyl-hydrolase, partial [Planctomycetota bacterium]|nr:GH116 family glycosyl-hydrolase [Planctomycetota bacterium]
MSIISRRTKRWDHSGVNLGGIGAGKIEFCPSGRFSNVMTQNNWDAPIAHVDPARRADYTCEGVPGAYLAAWVEGAGASALKETGRPGMRTLKPGDIRYEGRFPRAIVRYPSMRGVALEVEAFSSLDLASDGKDAYKDSALPAAVFLFRVRNASKRPRRASVMMSWQNLVGLGGFVDGLVADRRGPLNVRRKRGRCTGVVFGSTVKKLNPRVDGEYVLVTEAAGGREVFVTPGYDQADSRPGQNFSGIWETFCDSGTLPGQDPLWDHVWT